MVVVVMPTSFLTILTSVYPSLTLIFVDAINSKMINPVAIFYFEYTIDFLRTTVERYSVADNGMKSLLDNGEKAEIPSNFIPVLAEQADYICAKRYIYNVCNK